MEQKSYFHSGEANKRFHRPYDFFTGEKLSYKHFDWLYVFFTSEV